jgi:hypothetical protein
MPQLRLGSLRKVMVATVQRFVIFVFIVSLARNKADNVNCVADTILITVFLFKGPTIISARRISVQRRRINCLTYSIKVYINLARHAMCASTGRGSDRNKSKRSSLVISLENGPFVQKCNQNASSTQFVSSPVRG